MGVLVGIGPCFIHKGVFEYDPKRVPGFLIDPVTGLPPDMGGDPERAFEHVVCPPCAKKVNEERRRRGLTAMLDERDTLELLRQEMGSGSYDED